MNRISFIIFLLTLCSFATRAQSLREQVSPRVRQTTSLRLSRTVPAPIVISEEEEEPEAPKRPAWMLCTLLKKQHGWYDAVDEIDTLEAPHYEYYYRLSEPNAFGHWTQIECLTGSGRYKTGKMESYLMRVYAIKTDTTLNVAWARRANNICRRQMIADPTGREVMQERVFDPNDSLIYVYSRTRISPNQFIGSYRDAFGLPAEMHKEATFMLDSTSNKSTPYTYGTLVMLTEDHWGNDSIVQLLDAKGRPKLDSDSAWMQIFTFDKLGRRIKQQAADENGNLINDNWGTCGTEYVYNEQHKRVQTLNMDSTWTPTPMPAGRRVPLGSAGVSCKTYKYDRYGREVEKAYWNYPEMKPDTNALGAHVVFTRYNERGQEILEYGYDLNGKLHPAVEARYAVKQTGYDSLGRKSFVMLLDEEEHFIGGPHHCMETWDYEEDGSSDHRFYRRATDSTCCVAYGEEYRKNISYQRFADGTLTIDSTDEQGRLVWRRHYDADARPMMRQTPDGNYFSKSVSHLTLDDGLRSAGTITSRLDTLLRPVGTQTNPSMKVDITTCVDGDYYRNSSFFTPSDSCYRVETNLYADDKFERLKTCYSLDDFDNYCRTGGASPYLLRFYMAHINYSPNGKETTYAAIDEFGERDYIATMAGGVDCYQRFTRYNNRYFDDNDHEIFDMTAFKDSCHKALGIEVIDTLKAYRYGLRSGDIIYRYGHFVPCGLYSDARFLIDWNLASLTEAQNEKRVVVLRPDSQMKHFVRHELQLPEGTPSELGFIVHRLFRTSQQRLREQALSMTPEQLSENRAGNYNPAEHAEETFQRYQDSLRVYQEQSVNVGIATKDTVGLATISMDLFRLWRNTAFSREVVDPAVVLAARTDSTEWCIGQDETQFQQIASKVGKGVPVTLYLTTDGEQVQVLNITTSGNERMIFRNDYPQHITRPLVKLYRKKVLPSLRRKGKK